ncbi:unnamed protein product, partial [Protopolystoma xenopodis]
MSSTPSSVLMPNRTKIAQLEDMPTIRIKPPHNTQRITHAHPRSLTNKPTASCQAAIKPVDVLQFGPFPRQLVNNLDGRYEQRHFTQASSAVHRPLFRVPTTPILLGPNRGWTKPALISASGQHLASPPPSSEPQNLPETTPPAHQTILSRTRPPSEMLLIAVSLLTE